jgi:DNA-binding transcriptional regulator GbsR (MarR family)
MLLLSDLYPMLFKQRDPVTVTDMAATANVPLQTVSDVLTRLEDAGLASPLGEPAGVWRATRWASRDIAMFVRQAYAAGVRLDGAQLRTAPGDLRLAT